VNLLSLLKPLYVFKWHVDVGTGQISWFTGKLPEVMAIIYLLEKFGFIVPNRWIVPVGLLGLLGLALLGWFWKRFGLYDVERFVDTGKDPVANEVYVAAKKINSGGR